MRAFFGLAGILVVVGVIVWWLGGPGGQLDYDRAVIKEGNKARDEVSQVAGRDTATGGRAMDSATFEMLMTNGKPASLQVSNLVAGGAYERYFGLQKDDVITAIEYQGFKKAVREMDNAQDGKEQVAEAFQRHGTLTVKRAGKELTLPAAVTSAPPVQQQQKNSIQNQLDQIQKQVAQ